MVQATNIETFIDSRGASWRLWALAAMCFIVVAADGMNVAVVGFVTPSILQEWHLSRPAFGIVMSAAPLGLVAGALVAGPSADRWGRKPILIASVFFFGLLTIATAHASTAGRMAFLRLLSGMGLGAAMPTVLTLLSEYAPSRIRSLVTTIMFTGFNFGSALIGLAAGYLIPQFGWRSVLLFASVIPLLMVPILIVFLPESVRWLALPGSAHARIAALLHRVTGHRFAGDAVFASGEPLRRARASFRVLFNPPYASVTVTLWVACFMGLAVIYLLIGWLPTMMKDAGISIAGAAYATAMFQVGGTFGAVIIGWIMDKIRPALVVGIAYLCGAVCLVALAAVGLASPYLAVLVCLTGACMSGAQTGLNAYAPVCYPTAARATGVSWMLGIGRVGSILGSSLGGVLLGMDWTFRPIFASLAAPAIIATIALGVLTRRVSVATV